MEENTEPTGIDGEFGLCLSLLELLAGGGDLEGFREVLAANGLRPEPAQDRPIPIHLGDDRTDLSFYGRNAPSPRLLHLMHLTLRRIEESTRAAERLQQVSERSQLLSEASFEGILVHDGGLVLDANTRAAELLRAGPQGLVGRNVLHDCVAPEDLAKVAEKMRGGYEGRYLAAAIRYDGSRFLAELWAKEIRSSKGKARIVGFRDVTEREENLRLLRESEDRLRQLVDEVFDMTVFSREALILEVRGRPESFGLTREHLIGRSVLDFTTASDAPRILDTLMNQKAGRYETTLLVPSGEAIPVEVVGAYSRLDGVLTRVSGIRDLRPLKRLENERHRLELHLERSQRLNSVGALAGGIAHDFNNLLVGILGNADLLLRMRPTEEQGDILGAIVEASRKARDLTNRLLAYSGNSGLGLRNRVDVETLLDDLFRLHSFERSRGVHIEHEVERGAALWGDRAALTQVLLNLLSNAVDACEGQGGEVVLRVQTTSLPDDRWNHAVGATVAPGDWILVEVEDNGMGMPEATLSRVFEPFFSTKEARHGLGLASCLGIVEAHGGALHVRSDEGRGSCFSLLLPAAPPATPSERVQSRPSHPPARVEVPILVVDDEPLVRRQIRRTLELQGYTTLEAEDGHACLRLLETIEPSLLIVDVTMPRLSGPELVREIRSRGSDVPILMTSGYVDGRLESKLDGAAVDAFLAKPYSVHELLEAVERALRGAHDSAITPPGH